MLYRFPALFYRTQRSPCAPSGDGQGLSDGDKRALHLLYPSEAGSLRAIGRRREELVEAIEGACGGGEAGLEPAPAPRAGLAGHAVRMLGEGLAKMK